jgi:hypothetical protein
MLEAISQQTFETLENMEMKYLSFKTALLAALTSKKRVSELHAPSVHNLCLKFCPGHFQRYLVAQPHHYA